MNPLPQRRGFSLLELLVVVATIALILAILLPILGSAKDSARGVSCQSNLRQMGIAWESILYENGGRVPLTHSSGSPQWDTLLMDVTGLQPTFDAPAIACPVAKQTYGKLTPRPTSYAVNVLWREGEPAGDNEGQPWADLIQPSTYPLFGDPAALTNHNPPIIRKHMGILAGPEWGMGFIHSADTSGVAYGDGHVVFEGRDIHNGPTDALGRPLWFFNRDPYAGVASAAPPPLLGALP